MSDCRKTETVEACIELNDDSGSVSILHTTVFDNNGAAVAAYYHDENGNIVDESTFLGGGVATIGACQISSPECVESQEYTFAADNTTTDWRWDADYEIEWSDGRVTPFSQVAVPAADNWSGQMADQWQPNIEAALAANQIGAEVTVRFRNNPNQTDISGIPAQGSSPAIPGPPSVYISQSLGAIGYRYINIQVCLGQPTPVDLRLVKVTNTNGSTASTTPRSLIVAGPILGDLNKFVVCRECGKAPVWYLEDGVTLAELGQIPTCYEPCGTIAQSDGPASTTCDFESESGCDDVNGDGSNVVTGITRIYEICPNAAPKLFGHFIAGPDNNLVDYPMGGRPLVDCDTLEPIAEPTAPCTEFEMTKLFTLIGDDLNGTLVNREWQDTQPATPLFSDPVVATAEGRRIRDAHDFSLPTSNSGTQNTLALNDSDNTASELSIQVLDGFIEVKQGGLFRYAGSSEGYWAVELGECCGPMKDVAESGGFSPTRAMEFYLPKGFHQIRLWNVDSGGSNSSATFGYSPDGGVTYINDNTPPNVSFGSAKIVEECVTVKVCEDSGAIFNLLTGDLLDPAELYTCSRLCTACCGDNGDGDGGGSGETFDGNVTDVTPNPDQTHTLVSGTGNVPAGLKTVTINNITGTTTINGGFALGQGRRVDSISFDATEIDRARGLLPAMTLSGGTWQWVGLQPIAEA